MLQRAKVAWEQSLDDLRKAKSQIKSQPDKSSMLSTQAAINMLTAVLESKGYFQLPAYSPMEMLLPLLESDPRFQELQPHCQVLEGTLQRDVFGHSRQKGMEFTPSFAQACHNAAQQIHQTIKTVWPLT